MSASAPTQSRIKKSALEQHTPTGVDFVFETSTTNGVGTGLASTMGCRIPGGGIRDHLADALPLLNSLGEETANPRRLDFPGCAASLAAEYARESRRLRRGPAGAPGVVAVIVFTARRLECGLPSMRAMRTRHSLFRAARTQLRGGKQTVDLVVAVHSVVSRDHFAPSPLDHAF